MSEDGLAGSLDEIGRRLDEVADDNTALVAELRSLGHGHRTAAADILQELSGLRRDLEAAIAYQALRDLCTALIGPLSAMEAMLADADRTDPAVAAGHVRSVAVALRGVLTRMGAEVAPVAVGAEQYDPDRHRCVGVVPPESSPFPDAGPRTVVRVVENGYLLHRRPLLPVQVEIQADRRPAATNP